MKKEWHSATKPLKKKFFSRWTRLSHHEKQKNIFQTFYSANNYYLFVFFFLLQAAFRVTTRRSAIFSSSSSASFKMDETGEENTISLSSRSRLISNSNDSFSGIKNINIKFFTGVNNTAEKLFSDVNDTADKFIGGVVDTGDKRDLPILACLHLKIKNKQKFYL
jgi:hypothetical protein